MTKKTNTASTFAGAVAAALLIAAFGGTVACKKKETAPPRPAPETTTYSTPATAPAPASSGLEFREPFVHAKTLGVATALGIIVAEELEGFDVARVAPDDSLHELNLNIERPCVFTGGTAFSTLLRHTTVHSFPKACRQVKRRVYF